jgi:hypothetical protein
MSKEYRKARAIRWELVPGRDGGSPYVEIVFNVQGGVPEGYPDKWFGNTSSEKARKITEKAMLACGWDGYDSDPYVGLDTKDVSLTFGVDTYNGEDKKKILWVNDPDFAPSSRPQLSASEREAQRRKAGLGKPNPANKQPDDDDGIPF